MVNVIAVAISKGGTGKTTTAVSLGHGLALAGQRVLIVDLDTQSQVNQFLLPTHPTGPTSADIIGGFAPVGAAIIEARPNLDIIPGGVKLSAIPVTYGDEWKLAEALDPIAARYDWILIDCPPAWGMITILGLVAAARGILSPITLEPAGVRSFVQFRANLERLASIRKLAVDWILPTAVDRRRTMTTEIREQLAAAGGHLFPGIPQSAAVAAAPAWHQSIWEYDPKGTAAAAYQSVIEVLTQ